MPDSERERIVEAAKAAVLKLGGPAGLTVHRHRTRPLEQASLPAVVLLLGLETVLRQTSAPPILDRELIFRAECLAEGEPADEVLDPILTWVEIQLTTDPDFLALVRQVEARRIIWNQEDRPHSAQQPVAAVAVEFAVLYRTRFGDPTSPP
jgi:hypothetical protein